MLGGRVQPTIQRGVKMKGKSGKNSFRCVGIYLKAFLYMFVEFCFFGVILFSIGIYVSMFKWSPLYEPSGWQILAIPWISIPAFLFLEVLILIIDLFYNVSKMNKILPVISIGLFGFPLLIFTEFPFSILFNFFTLIVAVLGIVIMCFTTRTAFRDVNKNFLKWIHRETAHESGSG